MPCEYCVKPCFIPKNEEVDIIVFESILTDAIKKAKEDDNRFVFYSRTLVDHGNIHYRAYGVDVMNKRRVRLISHELGFGTTICLEGEDIVVDGKFITITPDDKSPTESQLKELRSRVFF